MIFKYTERGIFGVKTTLAALLCCLWSHPAAGQRYLFNTEIINVEDGLPHRNVRDIVQDKDGFIWLSTQNEVTRYDGYRFKTYDRDFLNFPKSGPVFLAVDRFNRLWCSSRVIRGSCAVIDIRKDSLYDIAQLSGGLLTSKDILHVGNIGAGGSAVLLTTRSGRVYRYDGDFTEIYRNPEPFTSTATCKAAADGGYWICGNDILKKVKDGKTLKAVHNEHRAYEIISESPDFIIKLDGIYNIKYRCWKLENDTLLPFALAPHTPEETAGIFRFHKDYTCYATDSIMIRDPRGKLLYSFSDFTFPGAVRKPGFKANKWLSDRQGILWIATENGLFKITARKNPFTILQQGNSIRGIFKDGDSLWTGGHYENAVINTRNNTKKQFWGRGTVMNFHKDLEGKLWMGTGGKEVVAYIPGRDSLTACNLINTFSFHLPYQNPVTKNYWLGSRAGLFRFDAAGKKVAPFSLPVPSFGTFISQFYQNTEGLWIVSDRGLFLMDAEKETILKHYTTANGLPTNHISHIYEDADGIFWLSTKGAGLVRWDRKNNTFTQYTREDGLSNDILYAVYEDDYGTLWLPSNYGLMAFDKTTAGTKVYLPQNGIAHEEFNTFAHFKDKDGTLYFGGLNGITKFHPRDFQKEANVLLPLYATRVRVLEKDAEKLTDKTAAYTKSGKITLKSGDRILEVSLTLLDYENSVENQYAYKFSGKQDQWIYTTGNMLTLNNPPYGHYNLVIKARGASGNWSENELTVPVYRPLPFYRQWWFFSVVLIAVAVVVMIAFRRRVRKLEKDRRRLEHEVQKRTWQIEQDKKIIEQDKKTIEVQAGELQALDKAKSRFFANITHEFRTPLTLITGPVEQLLANDIPDSIKAKIAPVKKNAKYLLRLVNQLLDIARLESGQVEVTASTADVVNFTGEIVQGFQLLAEEKAQQLIFAPVPEQWITHFDTAKYSDIIYNLVSNAIKYSPEKAVIALSLSKNNDADNEYITVTVKDTGIGIAPEALPYIFDRFYQADDSATRSGKGTGIGLSLVKELVELMNGRISVESAPGKGSIFTVLLPVLQAPGHPDAFVAPVLPEIPVTGDETAVVSDEKQATAYGKHKLELLIVEDNADMRAYIRSCIDASLYHITEATNGEEGIAKAQEIIPDLIISDVMMPKKDGFELTRALREHLGTSHIPLILLTAKASDESRLEGISRGADAYLTKPFIPEELTLRIKKLIELRQLLQERYRQHQTPQISPAFQKEDDFIHKLRDYILAHLNDPGLNGERLGQHFAMSRRQLYRKMGALTGAAVGDYVRAVRLETAWQLIKEQKLNMAEIAYETGFSSPSHFSRSFKKAFGKTPSDLL